MRNKVFKFSPNPDKTLDSLLIEAVRNPLGEVVDENRSTQTVARLLTRGANVNAARPDGVTALIIAVAHDHTEIVSTLLNCNEINVNAAISDGFTALMIAAHKGFAKTVSALLNCNRINVDAATPDGFTALMIAARKGHKESVSALLNFKEINVDAETNSGFTALMIAADNGHAESVLAILSRNGVDWEIVHDQLSRLPQKPNKEVSALLAVAIPRNLIFRNLNQENPNNTIEQEDDDILGAGLEAYIRLNNLRYWHIRYLTDLGFAEDEAKNLGNERFFDLLFNRQNRQEALARDNIVTELVAKSASLKIHFARNVEVTETEDQATLDAVRRLNQEDFYKLTTKIIDNSKAENGGIAKLQDLSFVAELRRISPPTKISSATAQLASSKQNGRRCIVS